MKLVDSAFRAPPSEFEMSREQLPTRTETAKYRKARRKRQRARRMRRVEAVLPGGRLPAIRPPQRRSLPGWPSVANARHALRTGLGRALGSGWHWSKLASGLLLIAAAAGIFWLHWDARWFVTPDTVAFDNTGYLDKGELYPTLEVEDWSIFWLQPDVLRDQALTHPYVTDAEVRIALPNQVRIEIEEAAPTALWVTQEGTFWLLEDGSALAMRIRPGLGAESALLDADGRALPEIVDVNRDAQTPGRSAIDPEVMRSALALLETFPDLAQIRYNRGAGLNFALPDNGLYVYWGDGYDKETKLKNLAAAQQLLRSGESAGTIIDVRYPERPFIQ